MKILIVSDIHGNREALEAINEEFDYMFCLGDIINFGPDPSYAVDFIRLHADYVIKGNHDHAIGFNSSSRCSGIFQEISEAMRKITLDKLSFDKIDYLKYLPVSQDISIPDNDFFLVHAFPSDPLYKSIQNDDYKFLEKEADLINSKIVFIGHSHTQWLKKTGDTTFISPGSVGMAKDNPGYACYAIWEDNHVEFKQTRYNIDKTCEKINHLPLALNLKQNLLKIFTTGTA